VRGGSGKRGKSRIPDEYLALTGSKSRKYAVFTLNRVGETHLRFTDGRPGQTQSGQKSA